MIGRRGDIDIGLIQDVLRNAQESRIVTEWEHPSSTVSGRPWEIWFADGGCVFLTSEEAFMFAVGMDAVLRFT